MIELSWKEVVLYMDTEQEREDVNGGGGRQGGGGDIEGVRGRERRRSTNAMVVQAGGT